MSAGSSRASGIRVPQLGRRAAELIRRDLPQVQAIYLYGSFARGEQRADSDLDLAVLPEPDATPDTLAMAGTLRWELGRDVDLVDLRRASTVLRKEIVADGLCLYARDAGYAVAWEARVLSDYAKLNEERAGILEDFSRSGIGYAPCMAEKRP